MAAPVPLDHPALDPPLRGASLDEADLTDRQKLAVVLQGASLLTHLARGDAVFARGWDGALVDSGGCLAVPGAEPGKASELPQETLASLLRRLFQTEDRIAGRGEARRAARALLEEWSQSLVAVPPERLVEQVLDEAPFLWGTSFAEARRRLVAVHEDEGGPVLRLAGPRRWRDRLLALAEDREELEALAASGLAQDLWQTRGSETERTETGKAGEDAARSLYFQGRFEAALDALCTVPFERGAVLRAGCHCYLDQLEAARRVLRRLEGVDLAAQERVECGEIAVRVLHGLGQPAAAKRWAEETLKAVSEEGDGGDEIVLRAHLLVAAEAWDRHDRQVMERSLETAREAVESLDLAWRWHHAAGLCALIRGDGQDATRELGCALVANRRALGRFEAAGVWNDLGVARGQVGDLAGAERAFFHAVRLYERCDGPRKVTVALQNLAEIRLRRGRPAGVRGILERSEAAGLRSGNRRARQYMAALWARYELVHGRPEAALAQCRESLEESGDLALPDLRILAARALGWLGRSEEAAEMLEETPPDALAALEPEEVAPLWALAGDRERALRETTDAATEAATGRLWRRLLMARPVPAEVWSTLDRIELFRAARCVFDADLLFPNRVPAELRRRAIATFRRVGAGWFAERLEVRDTGPWGAVAAYLAPGAAEDSEDALADLFAQAGYPEARLWWESDEEATVLVDGAGGPQELSAPAHGGRLVLRAGTVDGSTVDEPAADATLQALFRLALRGFAPRRAPSRPSKGGMVGESETFLQALDRLERFAASDLPVLIHGESGTGKELAARHVHRRSPRAEGSFVPVNCAALAENLQLSELFGHVRGSFTGADRDRAGVFETAQGGTVFLDEIGDLPASAQGMLLRVLQEGEVRRVGESLPRQVDVRVVAATHRDLEEMVRGGTFRQDLFYRLRGAAVTLPPLRDRGGDVSLLADHLLERLCRKVLPGGSRDGVPRLSSEARRALLAHSWPGNVRELENVLGTALALSPDGSIESEHLDLPRREAPAGDYHQQVENLRRKLIREALDAAGGNQSEAARRLGLTRQALSYLVRSLGVDPAGRR